MKTVLFTLLLEILCTVSLAYRTYYVEDDCISQKRLQKVVYNIPASGPNSVGEIRTNRFGTYSRAGRNCLIKLVPPKDYGVVVTVKKVDFRNHKQCDDYIMLSSNDEKGEKLCGYQDNGTAGKSYFSDDKMNLIYHTEDGGYGFNDGFRLIFTVAKSVNSNDECSLENQFKCDNSRCIWVGATCDGFNNCGDSSDENNSAGAKCATVTPVTVAVIALAVTTLFAILISVCLCCCRSRRENPDKIKEGIDFPSRPNGGYIPLPGYNISDITTRTIGSLPYNTYHTAYPIVHNSNRTSDGNRQPLPSPLDLPPPYKP